MGQTDVSEWIKRIESRRSEKCVSSATDNFMPRIALGANTSFLKNTLRRRINGRSKKTLQNMGSPHARQPLRPAAAGFVGKAHKKTSAAGSGGSLFENRKRGQGNRAGSKFEAQAQIQAGKSVLLADGVGIRRDLGGVMQVAGFAKKVEARAQTITRAERGEGRDADF